MGLEILPRSIRATSLKTDGKYIFKNVVLCCELAGFHGDGYKEYDLVSF